MDSDFCGSADLYPSVRRNRRGADSWGALHASVLFRVLLYGFPVLRPDCVHRAGQAEAGDLLFDFPEGDHCGAADTFAAPAVWYRGGRRVPGGADLQRDRRAGLLYHHDGDGVYEIGEKDGVEDFGLKFVVRNSIISDWQHICRVHGDDLVYEGERVCQNLVKSAGDI